VTTAAGKTDGQAPGQTGGQADDEKERLTALGGIAALSLDALSSVAYGPEAILVVLVAAGASALKYSLPITGAIVVLLAALVISYRQVIEAFPNGGGAYAVSKTHLGTTPSLVAAASLTVDYILNAAVGVSAGVEALTAAYPALYGARVWLCLAVLALITGANLWGVAESARLFMVPTLVFIVSIFAVIVIGLVRSHPVVALDHNLPQATDTVGVLLVLKAFASGCSALTGVEAIANSVPQFRRPRVKRAQHTEVGLGLLLGGMLIGLGLLIHHWDAVPQSGTTVLAQLTEGAIGHNALFYVIQIITLVLLSLAANTSFAGLPVLAGLLAHDNFLPHVFGLRADRRVFRYGVIVLAIAAALLLIVVRGDTQALVPLFAVGVFIGFTLSQTGMVKHWYLQRSGSGSAGRSWVYRAIINGVGAVLTFAVTIIELVSKFLAGAWLVAIVIPLLVLMFMAVARAYQRIGAELAIGQVPPHPVKRASLVIVPVTGMSRLTAEGISVAKSLGDDVIAVTVVFTDSDEDQAPEAAFRAQWQSWKPEVQLLTLRSAHRSIAEPIVNYLRLVEAEDKYHRLVVLIPEIQPDHPWQAVLHNQRGVILDRAIRRGTRKVILCRLRYRLETVVDDAAAAAAHAPAPETTEPETTGQKSTEQKLDFSRAPVNHPHGGGVLLVRLGESGTPSLNHVRDSSWPIPPGLACGAMSLDDIDARIITALIRDARASYAVIGDEVGLSAPAVKRRVDRLRASGAIAGFTARVDPAALGWTTEAYVELFCGGSTSPEVIAAAVRRHPEVADACTVTGEADALVHIRASDIRHFEQVVERIAAEPFVQRTRSVIVLSRLVERADAFAPPAGS
jgi:DNA-binding Lrp family transcriptional regulator/amino acid transporter